MAIAGGSDLGLFEVSSAAHLIEESAHADANIIFGTVIDDSLGDEVRVTVIAAGFDGGQPPRREPGIVRQPDIVRRQPVRQPSPQSPQEFSEPETPAAPTQSAGGGIRRQEAPPLADNELDIPDFLK